MRFTSPIVSVSLSVIGLSTTNDSLFFTRMTWRTCSSIDIKRWMMPIPPACAIAIPISLSVTVSILAEIIGICSLICEVKRVSVDSLRREATSECCGTKSTSSYVRPTSVKIFIPISSVCNDLDPQMKIHQANTELNFTTAIQLYSTPAAGS